MLYRHPDVRSFEIKKKKKNRQNVVCFNFNFWKPMRAGFGIQLNHSHRLRFSKNISFSGKKIFSSSILNMIQFTMYYKQCTASFSTSISGTADKMIFIIKVFLEFF